MRLERILSSGARLKSHFVGAGPEDGGDAKLYLEVQEVVPCVLEEQVLTDKTQVFPVRQWIFHHFILYTDVCDSHQEQVHCVESAEFLRDNSVASRASVQQRSHQSGYM